MQFIGFQLFSQNFKGKIINQTSQAAIPFATIYLVELQTSTTADSLGNFVFSTSIDGTVHFQISMLGFQTTVFSANLSREKERTFFMEESHLELREVVISTASTKLQQDNIVAVIQKNIAEISQKGSTNLTESISNIPGVDNFSTGSGIGKPVIRGLSGNRIVTYAQNIRVENQQWGDEHGLGIGEVGIENVEVIKGAASLLYGADAIGGVLFFTEERYAALNTTEGFVSSKLLSNTLGIANQVGFKSNKNNIRWNVFGAYSSNADYQLPNTKRVLNTRFDEANFKTSLGFNHKNWIGNLRYSFLSNNFGITESNEPSISTKRKPELPFQNLKNHLLTFENTYFIGKTKLNATIGYGQNNRKEFEDTLAFPNLNLLLKTLNYNFKSSTSLLNDRANLMTGVQGMFQKNTNKAEEILIPDASIFDVGAYSVLHFSATKNWKIEGGLRFDHRTISTVAMQSDEIIYPALKRDFNNFNFSLGSSFALKSMNFKANLATGFRAPNSAELLSNGVHEGVLRYEIGNNALKSEKATQFDFNWSFEKEHFSFYVNPFFNHIKDYIFIAPTDSVIEETPVFEYRQSTANLLGAEAGFHLHPHPIDWLHIDCNYSSVFAKDEAGNPLPLIPANKVQTMLKGEFKMKGKLKLNNVFVEHIYRFEQNKIASYETQTPHYQLFNTGFNFEYQAKKSKIEFTAGIKNIFNTAYIDHLSRFKNDNILNVGRNFYVSGRWDF